MLLDRQELIDSVKTIKQNLRLPSQDGMSTSYGVCPMGELSEGTNMTGEAELNNILVLLEGLDTCQVAEAMLVGLSGNALE